MFSTCRVIELMENLRAQERAGYGLSVRVQLALQELETELQEFEAEVERMEAAEHMTLPDQRTEDELTYRQEIKLR